MPAPKGNQYAVGNKGGGRPSDYRKEYAEMAYKITLLLGATDVELAEVFDVCETTINAWKKEHKDFYEALKRGKIVADANVADRLYQRAMGYEHPEVDIRVIEGQIVQTPITKIYAPDTTAGIFWLKNRARGKWNDRIVHAGDPDNPLVTQVVTGDDLAKKLRGG